MLHIILGILKVIGILLLVIIGLLLLMVLALLFVPVQYRFTGKRLEKVLEGQAAVSWLFRTIGLMAEYSGKQLVIRLKLFGFTLKSFGNEQKSEEKKKKKSGRKLLKKDSFKKEISENDAAKEDISERDIAEEDNTEGDNVKTEELQDEVSAENLKEADNVESVKVEPVNAGTDNAETEKKSLGEKISSLLERCISIRKRIFAIIGKIVSFIFSLPERILDIWGKLWDIADAGENTIDKLEKKKDALYKLAKPFLTDNSKALYKRILGHLLYLWKHYKPRKIQGWMKYGTGAPDVTGQITGVLYMILPVSAEKFELMPEFTEMVFETDVTIKGHIRACHLLKVAFLLWRDKQLWLLIRRIRAKGGK